MPSTLLQGGTVILLDDNDTLYSKQHDVLIQDDIVTNIGPNLNPPTNCEIIDCSDKIISPGFVDTHRHMWETALKGLCEDLTCVSYFAQSMSTVPKYIISNSRFGSVYICFHVHASRCGHGHSCRLHRGHRGWHYHRP